jgi:hypothetical protein
MARGLLVGVHKLQSEIALPSQVVAIVCIIGSVEAKMSTVE